MVVWSIMLPIFFYTTLYNLRVSNIKVAGKLKQFSGFVQRHHGDILILWYLLIIGTILVRFWDYWQTLI